MSGKKEPTLADGLAASGFAMSAELQAALGGDASPKQGEAPVPAPEEDPMESDFFKAMNAFRAARSSGDSERMREAEAALRAVVRSELEEGEDCGC